MLEMMLDYLTENTEFDGIAWRRNRWVVICSVDGQVVTVDGRNPTAKDLGVAVHLAYYQSRVLNGDEGE